MMRSTNVPLAMAALVSLLLCCPHRAALAQTRDRAGKAKVASPAAKKPSPPRADQGETAKIRITRRPRAGQSEGGPGQPFALDPEDAEWAVQVNANGQIEILHWGLQVVRAQNLFLAAGARPADARIRVASRMSDQVDLAGTVDALGLNVEGWAFPISPRELRLELEIDATKAISGITGGGLAWSLKLDSPSFGGQAPEPKLLLDGTGWRWPVAEGQEILVRFDERPARVFFEKDQKQEIRTNFVGDRVRPGREKVGLSVILPEGGRVIATADERYARPDASWFRGALEWDGAPVDLSFLNAGDRPAGSHGIVRADGERLVFEDGTPARFWGANLSGPVLFSTPRESIPRQARRMARLGYNLMRIVQHEANWVSPNVFGSNNKDTRHLDPRSMDTLDYWIKCLKDEGIYVWLDMHYLRELRPGDGVTQGYAEIAAHRGNFFGYNYVNPQLFDLMKEFQHQYLGHVNGYTRVAYKDEPAVIGILLTNENTLTSHFGVMFLPNQNNPFHKALFDREMQAFARASGLPPDRLWRSWEPGPAKYFLNELEHRFNRAMIDDLRADGLRVPIATSNLWGMNMLLSLPALSEGDVVDTHAYGEAEGVLSTNPHHVVNLISWIAAARVYGKPLVITEWNVPYPHLDRFTAPLYVAGIASLQGWDVPMIYNYSQTPLQAPGRDDWGQRIDKWSTFYDPAISGIMPAAALAFRQRHISPARANYCLKLTPAQLLDTMLTAENTKTLRTLVEQSRFSIGLPPVKELPWLKPSEPSGDVTVVTDPHHDYLPAGQSWVTSDTGELTRNWKQGVQTIDTPRTQAVSGWIGGRRLTTKDATFEFSTKKSVVALTSVDNRPLESSRFILVTAIGQARPSLGPNQANARPAPPPDSLPFLSERVVGTIKLRTRMNGLELLSLGSNGKVAGRSVPARDGDSLTISLPAARGTHWYILKAGPGGAAARPEGQPAEPNSRAASR
jgi:hypothetical protein